MPKAYVVTTYRSIKDPKALAEYAKLATPAVQAGGGRFLARGDARKAYELGQTMRTVVIEFPSFEAAVGVYEGPAYARALAALGKNAAERDMRIVEGVE